MLKTKFITLLLTMTALSGAGTAMGGTAVTTYAAELPECQHSYIETVHAPTCMEQGFTLYTCEECGDTYQDHYTKAKGHNYKEVIVPATCDSQGFTTHLCLDCGFQYSDNYTDAFGHTFTDDVIFEPTCTEMGYTEHTCEVCGTVVTDTYVEALGHDYEEEIVDATCTEDGYTIYTCKRCGESHNDDVVEAKGHLYLDNVVYATCVSYGYTEHICQECDARYVTDYVNPLGHDYKDEVVPATEDQLGYTKHSCLTCGHTYLSDFSTSEDGGYIPEEPEPPVHTHSYTLTTTVNRVDKVIKIEFVCECGEEDSDLLNVLFTGTDGEIVIAELENGAVSYADLIGTQTVTVVDDNGNVLKVFELVLDGTIEEPTEPVEPENPDDGNGDEHTHNLYLSSELSEADGYMVLSYTCDCGEVFNEQLVVTFTDENGEVMTLPIDENGRVDFSAFVGSYEVTVTGENGEVLTTFDVTLNDEMPVEPTEPDDGNGDVTEPENPDDKNDDSDKDDNGNAQEPDEKGNSNLAGVLFGVLAVLAIGGIATIIIIKKKNKK